MKKDKPIAEAPKHARLSPSASERWLACPGSVQASGDVPDASSEYAAEGTMLHHFTYLRVKGEFNSKGVILPAIGSKHEFDGYTFTIDQEHIDCINEAAERIFQLRREIDDPDAEWYFETRLNLSCIEPGMFGTGDVIVVSQLRRTVWTYDYKFGRGVRVDACENSQLICYTLGVWDWTRFLYDIDRFVFGVIQPRLDNYDTHEMLLPDLEVWHAKLKSGASETHNPKAKLAAGDHCKFCPAKPRCPAIEEKALAVARDVFSDPIVYGDEAPLVTARDLPETRIAEIVKLAPMVREWLDSIELEAKRRLEGGLDVPGYKLVAGQKKRQWTDEEAVKRWAKENAITPYDIKLLSPAGVEEICKRTKIPFPAALVTRPAGSPSLVAVTDKRPSIGPVFDAITPPADQFM